MTRPWLFLPVAWLAGSRDSLSVPFTTRCLGPLYRNPPFGRWSVGGVPLSVKGNRNAWPPAGRRGWSWSGTWTGDPLLCSQMRSNNQRITNRPPSRSETPCQLATRLFSLRETAISQLAGPDLCSSVHLFDSATCKAGGNRALCGTPPSTSGLFWHFCEPHHNWQTDWQTDPLNCSVGVFLPFATSGTGFIPPISRSGEQPVGAGRPQSSAEATPDPCQVRGRAGKVKRVPPGGWIGSRVGHLPDHQAG